MKKILCLLIAIFGMITCVNAATYTAYKVGNEIEVNLNSTTKIKFIVIKDSDASTREVMAIYKDTLPDVANYQNKFTYSEASAKIEVLKTEWSNVTSISHPTMEELFGDKDTISDQSFHFNEPKWLITDLTWWTSSSSETDGGVKGHWTVGSNLSKEGVTGVFEDAQQCAIRPVINVNKDYVVNGVVEEETPEPEKTEVEKDKIWDDFIKKYINTEFFKKVNENYKLGEIAIISNEKFLEIRTKDGENIRSTIFEYEDGIVTYVSATDDVQALVDAPYILNCIDAISELKGYDVDKIREWMLNNPDVILPKDGIQYEIYEVSLKESNGTVKSDAFKSFQINIKDGLSNYDIPTTPTPEVVPENPHTGIALPIILVIALAGIGTFIYITKGKDLLKKI